MCAWMCLPSAARVTSTSVSDEYSPEKVDTRLAGWLFHRSEKYCDAMAKSARHLLGLYVRAVSAGKASQRGKRASAGTMA